ncbi:ATPase domain-containing protein [Roseicella sp. DB1501]|uniref:ATPase domain-containing protein n=1 Tax=Roseicella sp. DB1501 TaxID=2730925 RepID=UPI0020C4EB5E|nr:ATPase domain-containing protein [Roseicella sp. DB1501]
MTDAAMPAPPQGRAATGIAGLDDVLATGLIRNRLYLVEGNPGTGKTTLGLQFLLEGARAGERGLYVTLSETAAELRDGAASHGWSLDGIEIFELVPPEDLLDPDQQQSLLYASDLELGEATRSLLEAVERIRPHRVVLDSLSEFRLLAQGSLRYRRQVLTLKHHFARLGATVLMLDDMTAEPGDKTVHSVAHGVLRLEELAPDYGAERRRLRVMKYRGTAFRGGHHDFTIAHGGVRVFPRLVSAEHHTGFRRDRLDSGIPELDALLGGGVECGTSTLLLGPAGTGKSLFALNFAAAAVRRGEQVLACIFDEEVSLLLDRSQAMGLDLGAMRSAGSLILEQVDAAEISPGAFAHAIRAHVEAGVRTVVIDSLNGYQAAMPGEQFLVLHMHELLQYLNRQAVSTFLIVSQHGLVGDMQAPVDVTYLADTVLLLRYFEAVGQIRRAISVVKKRAGGHESTIREFRIDAGGVRVGKPLEAFQGVLRGVPTYVGKNGTLIEDGPA